MYKIDISDDAEKDISISTEYYEEQQKRAW